jgi:ubiquinone/menaquinone biosynthesis C-methylase UbiE
MQQKDHPMTDASIRFNDGAAYERMMGGWSRIAGDVFLDWLAPRPDLAWVDIGCGNGAFTQSIIERCRPSRVEGIDPSDPQLAYARSRAGTEMATFTKGDAMALPFADRTFDAAVMALVIFFVPEPARGVAEMARVTAPGGLVAAYAWDMAGGGFPLQPLLTELLAMGHQPSMPPSPDASKLDAMQQLWSGAGLVEIESRTISVQRSFTDFDDYWGVSTLGPSVAAALTSMTPAEIDQFKSRVRANLKVDGAGPLTFSARANAIKGRVPK